MPLRGSDISKEVYSLSFCWVGDEKLDTKGRNRRGKCFGVAERDRNGVTFPRQ